jgi:hypothetical protein
MTPQTITAVFDNLKQSERAYEALVANGSDPEEISVRVKEAREPQPRLEAVSLRTRLIARVGIIGAFALGGGIGAFLGGYAAHITTGIATAMSLGCAGALVGIALGGSAGHFVAAMADGAVVQEHAQTEEEGQLLGEVVLTVETCSNISPRVAELLRREGAWKVEVYDRNLPVAPRVPTFV